MRLIDMEKRWEMQDCLGTSVLHFILEHLEFDFPGIGRIDQVTRQQLLEKIASNVQPNHPSDIHGRSVLHIAAECGLSDVTEALLNHGINANARTVSGYTALHYAAALGHFESCEALLRDKADPNLTDIRRCSALHYAARNGHVDIVDLLLNNPQINVNQQGWMRDTPLMTAIRQDDTQCAYKAILKHSDVDLNARDEEGRTALHLAVLKARTSAVQDLSAMEGGISINEVDDDGNTALGLVSAFGTDYDNAVAAAIVQALLQNQHIDASIPDKTGKTPLWKAAYHGNLGGCHMLGMRVDSAILVAYQGKTPREIALEECEYEVAVLLKTFEDRISPQTGA